MLECQIKILGSSDIQVSEKLIKRVILVSHRSELGAQKSSLRFFFLKFAKLSKKCTFLWIFCGKIGMFWKVDILSKNVKVFLGSAFIENWWFGQGFSLAALKEHSWVILVSHRGELGAQIWRYPKSVKIQALEQYFRSF